MTHPIVIPAAGPTLDDASEARLPHAPYLLFVAAGSDAFEAVPNPGATAQSHRGIVVAKLLLERGVEAVLAHHMGPHPSAALTRRGVRVFEGRPGTSARELLALYRQGALVVLDEEEINARLGPAHHGRGHGHGTGTGSDTLH
jgi:predicted Fe-Mo cluster-binding NifX family protein